MSPRKEQCEEGIVVAAHGRHFCVQQTPSFSAPLILAHTRGKRNDYACGDRVLFRRVTTDRAVIEARQPRTTLLYRADAVREKLLAANVDLVVVVTAVEPSFSPEIVSRCLVAAEAEGIAALILLNKCDLPGVSAAEKALAPFVAAGYPVLALSAHQSVAELAERLDGHRAVLVGQSGMGKSTIVNALIPQAEARIGEISRALDSGRHTTTFTRLYPFGSGWLIDSPGLQRFGLAHIDEQMLPETFPEFRPYLGQCRFRDCRHDDQTPGCAITAAVAAGRIAAERWRHFVTLSEELRAVRRSR